MIALSLEEFAAKRRTAQADLEERFAPLVRHAINDGDWALLTDDIESIYHDLYADEAGEPGGTFLPTFRKELLRTLKKTKGSDEPTVHRVSAWLATRVLSEVTADAAIHDEAELFLEWVDMDDSKVRPTHKAAAGQQRPIGDKFQVGDSKMRHPGDTSAPLDEWMECRCTLRPVLASEVKASFAISEKPWSGSASRFTDEQWKSSCILHLADTLNKSDHKLPIKEPGGSLSRAGVHAAASRFGSTDGSPEAKAKAKASLRGAYKQLGEEVPDNLTAAGSPQDKAAEDKNTAVVLLPHKDHPVHKIGDEQKHVTIAHMRGVQDPAPIQKHAQKVASLAKDPAVAHVSGKGQLGPDAAKIWLLESHDLQSLHDQVCSDPEVAKAMADPKQHPNFIPHMTATYGDEPDGMDDQDEITFDRLAVWHGDDQQEYQLGGDMPDDKKPDEKEPETPDAQPTDREDPPSDQVPDDKKIDDEDKKPGFSATPFHSVLAVEGIWTGDKRKFNEGSLSNRPLPIPLTWQKVSAAGHDGNVVVGKIEQIKMVNGEQRGVGHILSNAEADEFVGLLAEFGRFGVSVDADSVVFDLEGSGEDGTAFAEARTSAACAVAIPALAEAWVSLGEAPEDWDMTPDEVPDEALVASLTAAGIGMSPDFLEQLKRGPGWITNPEATRRIHAYWTQPGQEGYAKVNWGVSGDFNRCRVLVGEEIAENSPEDTRFLNQICAQWHHDALGIWPGQEAKAADTLELSETTMAPSVSLVAGGALKAPAAWFQDPKFAIDDGRMFQDPKDGTWGCPFTVTDDGQVFGHVAKWGTCHIGFAGTCTVAPHSQIDYAHFLFGQVPLDDGTRVSTGCISIGGGHAGPRLSARAAIAHYDSTSTAACDITVGEDEFGIWCAGRVRPGVSDEMVSALMASKLSGDWRFDEMVAVLAVNVPGFGVARPRVAAANGEQISLVAAGVVAGPEEVEKPTFDVAEIAQAVVAEIAATNRRKSEMAQLAEEFADGVRV